MMPETFAFIGEFADQARQRGIEVLVEVHAYHRRQIEIARSVDWVYDFALPPLVLHAFEFQTAGPLKHWVGIRPANALTVLDTHDGIGIIDIGADAADRSGSPGLVPDAELDELVERIHANSRGHSRRATGEAASNLDLYQVNCSFYDAMGRDDGAYLLARAVQFFLPGVPQVYYMGLLAGENDMALLSRTGVGRDINRSHCGPDDIAAALDKPVVQRLLGLIRLRNEHPAFSGRFELLHSGPSVLTMRWQAGDDELTLSVDFAARLHTLSGRRSGQPQVLDLLEQV
jgi:sucrose phosphorylase